MQSIDRRDPRLLFVPPLLAGVVLRLWQFSLPRSFWLDEIRLVMGTLRPWSELFEPMQFNQTAAIGFLAAEKLATAVLGHSEYAYRLLPLLLGLATLPIFYRLARSQLSDGPALLAVTLFSLAPIGIHFSAEAKQYAGDLFFAVLLTHLTITRPRGRALLIAGIVAPWFSQPALFLLAGLGAWLAVEHRRRGLLIAWATSGALAVAIGRLAASPELIAYMLHYWRDGFVPWDAQAFPHAVLLLVSAFRILGSPPLIPGAAVLTAIGSLQLRRASLPYLLPGALAFTAAALHVYPFGNPGGPSYPERLIIIVLPSICILSAVGAGRLANLAPRVVAAVVTYMLVALGAAVWERVPENGEDLRPVFTFIAENRRPDDQIDLGWFAATHMAYYGRLAGLGEMPTIAGIAQIAQTAPRRTWVVWALRDTVYVPGLLRRLGPAAQRIEIPGARYVQVVLYQP